MATFPAYVPSYDPVKTSNPRIRTTQFGDGYSQRTKFGLHNNAKEWRLTFDLKNADADVVEAFLDARAEDAASFNWTAPGKSTAQKWVCPSWDRQYTGPRSSVITCTFKEVFEP